MSLKPPKKSDMAKSWMGKRVEKKKQIQPEYHLIVTEGTDTEPAYFGAIRNKINLHFHNRIALDVHGEGDNTVNLFERAKARASRSAVIYRHVWVVYDTDDFPADHVDRVVDLCQQASTEETEYHAIWSNQCIELWFLLHFSFMHSDLRRSEYWPKLTELLTGLGAGEYRKNRGDMFALLQPYMGEAIRNAKALAEYNTGRRPSQSAPGTTVYQLIEKLLPYLH